MISLTFTIDPAVFRRAVTYPMSEAFREQLHRWWQA